MKVLFVCRMNVSRSQMAEKIFKMLSDGNHSATSAGTQVHEDDGQKLKDRPGASNMLVALKEIGIDATENVRTQLTPELIKQADIVISMAEKETLPDYLIASSKTHYWNLTDPLDRSIAFSRARREEIGTLVRELLETELLCPVN